MTEVTVIILTKDEARHIGRAIASVQDFATRVIVVDSGSTDETIALARQAGAQVMTHAWTNHAAQFNWALDQIKAVSGWVLRLDADEFVTKQLADEIKAGLPDVDGCYIGRRIQFMGELVRYGGVFPVQIMRLFRNGKGCCENRWMDEHIVVQGPTAQLRGEIIDDNLNALDWWIAKHNAYASREVADILNRKHRFMPDDDALPGAGGAAVKRWIKTRIYGRLPGGLRAGLYFLYRFVVRFGFLDRPAARRFHVLQGFWYRYLVDAKLAEVERFMHDNSADPRDAIEAVLGFSVRSEPPAKKEAGCVKISVVTAVINGAATLPAMLSSLKSQTHPMIEHVVQDGGSTDGTLELLHAQGHRDMALRSASDTGIYDAINQGISRATGDVIGLLHADDQLAGADVLVKIAEVFENPDVDGVYGDLQYVAADDEARVIRHWTAGPYHPARLKAGWMPPHPTLYLRREVFTRVGLYDTSYRISGDYDGMLRFLTTGQVRLAYIPEVMVRMKMGGVSNRSFAYMIRKSREDYRAIRRHGVGGFGTLLAKNLSKLPQFAGRRQV